LWEQKKKCGAAKEDLKWRTCTLKEAKTPAGMAHQQSRQDGQEMLRISGPVKPGEGDRAGWPREAEALWTCTKKRGQANSGMARQQRWRQEQDGQVRNLDLYKGGDKNRMAR